jgi:hypothetical protein
MQPPYGWALDASSNSNELNYNLQHMQGSTSALSLAMIHDQGTRHDLFACLPFATAVVPTLRYYSSHASQDVAVSVP